MYKKGCKKAQVTVFIIIAIVIVGAIVLFFSIKKPSRPITPAVRERINLQECVGDSIKNALEIILSQGGMVNPTNYYLYKGKKVAFLCYTNKFYEPCVVQVPFLEEEIKKSMKSMIGDKIKDCFSALEQDYRDRGYTVQSKPLTFNVEILPNKVSVIINKSMIFIKDEERKVYEEFEINTASQLFNILMAVHDTIDQEARFCNFEYIGYSLVHPELSIRKDTIDTEIKIYTIKAKKTGEEINFAIKSCAMPPNMI